jgi:hypothetical protein
MFARHVVRSLFAALLVSLPASASNLVTGNGFGFAVVSPETGTVSKFYAHPYSFVGPDPMNPLSEGIATANFIKSIGFGSEDADSAATDHEDDSHVIRVHSRTGEGFVFMPFGLHRAALIVNWEPVSADKQAGLHVEWNRAVRSERKIKASGKEMRLLKFEGIAESLLLVALGSADAESAQLKPKPISDRGWALISLESVDDIAHVATEFDRWRAGMSLRELAKREVAELEQWRVKPVVQFVGEKERHLWRQSEVMLRIAQSREPNRPGRNSNGLIVASLPDGAWFTPWVRDMAWATVALARMGHRDEARAALLAYFNAQPTGKMRVETGGADYQVSVVRYFGDGSEEPFFTMEGSTNIEFDDWGEALWALGEFLRRYDDNDLLRTATYRGSLYESARDFVVKPLLKNCEKFDNGLIVAADTSIWEERQRDKKHFAFSTAMAIVGLKSFSETARRAHDEATRVDTLSKVALLEKGFAAAFIRDGKLRGTLEEGEKNDIDGALLPIINFGVVTDPAVVRDTVERMELLKVPSGGYRRVRSTYTDPSIFEYWYERQEFVFVDLSLAELLRRLGRKAQAETMVTRIVEKASADHNIIPEMYVAVPCKLFPGKIGDPTGAIPMVGYGAGAYILDLLQRTLSEDER